MENLLQQLVDYGADMEGAMGRFLGDTELYSVCFSTFLADEAFSKLGQALDLGDYHAAFESAHTLKGVTGNMGLTPLYEVICRMVETLRRGETCGLQEDYSEVRRQLAILEALAN